MTPLTATNFLKYFAFHPDDQALSKSDQHKALIGSIAFGVLTLGMGHLFCRLFLYDRKFAHIQTPTKSSELFKNTLAKENKAPEKQPIPDADSNVLLRTGKKTPIPDKAVAPRAGVAIQPNAAAQSKKMTEAKFGDVSVKVVSSGDLCKDKADAVVNAANEWLKVTSSCSGVCKAIYENGGSEIHKECQAYLKSIGKSQVEAGHAMISGPGKMQNTKNVIHTVGPRWDDNDSSQVKEQKKQALYDSYYNSLLRAHENGLTSIIFPSIGTGKFKFPVDFAGPLAIKAFKDFATNHPNSSLKDITLIAWGESFNTYGPELVKQANS